MLAIQPTYTQCHYSETGTTLAVLHYRQGKKIVLFKVLSDIITYAHSISLMVTNSSGE